MVGETMSRITYTTDQAQGAAEADLVVEAIVENLETKQKLFKALDSSTPRYSMTPCICSPIGIFKVMSIPRVITPRLIVISTPTKLL